MVGTESVGVSVSVAAVIHWALERLLPGVQPLVRLELTRLDEGAGAVGVVAVVGPLPRVGPQVGLQRLLTGKVPEIIKININIAILLDKAATSTAKSFANLYIGIALSVVKSLQKKT